MPLPLPDCARKASHQRSITIRAYDRDDGLCDIEGHLTDVWPESMPVADGVRQAGEPMHSMWLRLTVDRTATIVAVQADIDAGPYDKACSSIAPDYAQLVGVRVAKGYRDAVRRLFGRTAGCTHMNELAGAMGSAALQALWSDLTHGSDEKPFSIDGLPRARGVGSAGGPVLPALAPGGERGCLTA